MSGPAVGVVCRRRLFAAVVCLIAPSILTGCARDRPDAARTQQTAADSLGPGPTGGAGAALPESAGPPRSARSWDGDAFPADSLDRLNGPAIRWGVAATAKGATPLVPASWSSLLDRYRGVWLGDAATKEIFLTLDAGYESGYTAGLLDVLKDEGVRAIFFVTGHYLKTQPRLVLRMVAEGHAVGNHTRSHASMPRLEAADVRDELLGVQTEFEALAGAGMLYFRPPSGELNELVLAVADLLGYVTVMWSLAYKDWEPVPGGPDGSHRIVLERLHGGAVVLLHVTSKDSAGAFRRIIQSAKQQGYTFGTPERLRDLALAGP